MSIIRERYAAFMDRQHQLPSGWIGRRIGERMLRQHAPETRWTLARLQLRADDRVLELGCGAGQALGAVAQAAGQCQVVGVDLSPAMLSASWKRNRAAIKAGHMLLLQGDIAALPLAGRQFDKIFSIHTFYFWPDPLATITQLFHLLRPQGRLALTLSTGRVLATGARSYGLLHTTLVEQIVPAMRQLGFASVELEQGPDSRQYTSVALIAERAAEV